jgi:predicted Rossmann-fold nucleotide-binding protein
MDEIFETATLVQTGKISDFPLVIMGRDYWRPMLDYLDDVMVPTGTISPEDPQRLHPTDSPEEAVRIVVEAAQRFGARDARTLFPSP